MAQNDLADDTYGIVDPTDLLAQQSAAYERSQQNSNATARNNSSILNGINGMFGGGAQVQQAARVQSQLQSILANVNSNSDQNEDPLTKQLRTANAISQGMIGISPQIALKAQDQAVRLAQAQQQQKLLGVRTEQEQEELSQAKFKSQVQRNTPQTLTLVADQGKDAQGLPLGFQAQHTYDLTDPNSGAQIRADMQTAQSNGQSLIPMTADQLANSKVQVATANAQARYQAAVVAAMSREKIAAEKPQSSSINDRFANRIMSAADTGSAALSSIASLPFGTVSQNTYNQETSGLTGFAKSNLGLFGGAPGAVNPGASIWELAGQHLRSALTTDDQKLYNTFMTGLEQNLATIDRQGLGSGGGGQTFAHQIRDALRVQPTDSPIVVMGKLAEARQIMDRGTEVYLSSKSADPGVVSKIQQRLDEMHQAVPWTREDVIAFDRASQTDPTLSFAEYAQKHGVAGAASGQSQNATRVSSPPMAQDTNGTPARIVFGGGQQVPNNGVPQ